MSTQFATPTPASFEETVSGKPNTTKQHQQQQQQKTTLPTSPSSMDHSTHKPPMFTFDGDELSKEGETNSQTNADANEDEEDEEEKQDQLNPYQYDIEPPAIFERSVQDCCSPHRTNSIISLTNTLNNYTPSCSTTSASGCNNNNNNASSSSSTSISNLSNSLYNSTNNNTSGRRKSIIKRPRSSTTNSFSNNRLEDSFTPLNTLITSFDSNNNNTDGNNDAAIANMFPLSPNSPPKLKHTQSQLNCCSYAELINDESWSSRGGLGGLRRGQSQLLSQQQQQGQQQQQQPPFRSTQSTGMVPTLRSPKWRR